MKKKKKPWLRILTVVIVILLLAGFVYMQNNMLVTTAYEIQSEQLQKDFVIAHISDLHGKVLGLDNNPLLRRVESSKPDIIVITGDLMSRRADADEIERYISSLIPRLAAIAPVYFVTGNHDIDNETDYILSQLEQAGAIVLNNRVETIKKDGVSLSLVGIADLNAFHTWLPQADPRVAYAETLSSLLAQSGEGLRVVLAHRPELFELYKNAGEGVYLCGHAHGGQIQLPFVGGIFSPGEGFFPKYYEGLHSEGGTTMIVSRGIGNSVFPLRVFNYPELVVLTISPSNARE